VLTLLVFNYLVLGHKTYIVATCSTAAASVAALDVGYKYGINNSKQI